MVFIHLGSRQIWASPCTENPTGETLKHEVLNGFCIVTNQHLDKILSAATDWYNHRRGHTARDHLPPIRDDSEPETIDLKKHRIVCHTELGGLLKSYHRAA